MYVSGRDISKQSVLGIIGTAVWCFFFGFLRWKMPKILSVVLCHFLRRAMYARRYGRADSHIYFASARTFVSGPVCVISMSNVCESNSTIPFNLAPPPVMIISVGLYLSMYRAESFLIC